MTLPDGKKKMYYSKRFTTKRRGAWLGFFMLLIMGFLLTFLIQSNVELYQMYAAQKAGRATYITQYDNLYEENHRLRASQLTLEEERKRLVDQVLLERGYEDIAKQLETMRLLAGLTPITGEGVRIALNDATVMYQNCPEYSVIHSQDVQYVVDLLKAYDAIAIAINDQRIVMTSSLYCAGPTIRINQSRHQVPFVITVICDSTAIYDILRDDTYLRQRRDAGIRMEIEMQESLTIPAFINPSIVDRYYNSLSEGGS